MPDSANLPPPDDEALVEPKKSHSVYHLREALRRIQGLCQASDTIGEDTGVEADSHAKIYQAIVAVVANVFEGD